MPNPKQVPQTFQPEANYCWAVLVLWCICDNSCQITFEIFRKIMQIIWPPWPQINPNPQCYLCWKVIVFEKMYISESVMWSWKADKGLIENYNFMACWPKNLAPREDCLGTICPLWRLLTWFRRAFGPSTTSLNKCFMISKRHYKGRMATTMVLAILYYFMISCFGFGLFQMTNLRPPLNFQIK